MDLDAVSSENNINTINLDSDFNSEIFIYSCSVENYINKINVNAKSNVESANVEISGNENLKEGLNEILITVKDDNNEKVIYKIYVNKEKKVEDELKEDNKNINSVTIIIAAVIACLILVLIVSKLKVK